MYAMSGDEISERLIVGLESFLSLGIAFLSAVTGTHIAPLSTPAICHFYGWDSPTTEFFLEKNITPEDDVCVASDWLVLLFQFLLCHVISWWSRWLLWDPMARWYFHVPERKLRNFSQALVANVFHIFSAFFAWRILTTHPWLWSPDEWNNNQGLEEEDPTVAPDLKFYYLLYAARYTSDLISLYYEPTKSDTWAYAVHHAVTIALVLISATQGYFRIGCVLMFFLDWADPFLLTAKLFRYASTHRNDVCQWIANRFFEAFAVVFVLTRVILLNYVVWMTLKNFPDKKARLCKMCCILLTLLQLFWFAVIVQTALHKFCNNGNADDIQSDSDDDDEPEQKRIARKKQQ